MRSFHALLMRIVNSYGDAHIERLFYLDNGPDKKNIDGNSEKPFVQNSSPSFVVWSQNFKLRTVDKTNLSPDVPDFGTLRYESPTVCVVC